MGMFVEPMRVEGITLHVALYSGHWPKRGEANRPVITKWGKGNNQRTQESKGDCYNNW